MPALAVLDLDMDYLKTAARRAGDAILAVYGETVEVEVKADNSPLTLADRRSQEVIAEALRERYPEIPVISEETLAAPPETRAGWERCWLVDPLDGTKEFIKRNGEFTVNIALVERGEPVAGVVFQPVGDRLYWAARGEGAWRSLGGGPAERLEGGPHYLEADPVAVVASRSHLSEETRAFIRRLEAAGKTVEFLSSGSSLKICLVAEGAAHVYPRLAPTMEWDTAAADAVAREAGRRVLDWRTREPLRYNKADLLNPWFVVE